MPRGREKNVIGGTGKVYRRGEGLGTGPVLGTGGGHVGGSGGSGGGKRSGGGMGPLGLIIAVVVMLLGGGGGLSMLNSGSGEPQVAQTTAYAPAPTTSAQTSQQGGYGQGSSGGYGSQGGYDLASLFGQSYQGVTSSSTGWSTSANTGQLNTRVSADARPKYTKILGNGKDKVTIMVYMCGADLESRNGMATADLSEMASATLSDNVNILVYTGGARSWKNQIVSSNTCQIYRVVNGGKLERVVADDGDRIMTNPETLTRFIKWCAKNYPANRNELIFWDHGGGSVSGYGYDEKNPRAGSMTLSGINKAISGADMKFDFIGFDTCLMATAENALMLAPYADYLIASEETEPGLGWYYTSWLTKLSQNPSMPTLEIGKNIIDDFVNVSAQKCRGQSTTLSMVDLSELSETLPDRLSAFAQETSSLIENKEYRVIADARNSCREFAKSSRIDQVDLVDFAVKMGTDEAKTMASTLLEAIKYNRTSSNMTSCYGLSIYFPQKKLSSVDSMVNTYQNIGMDEDYVKAITQFATVSASGQAVTGGAASPFGTLTGSYGGSSSGSYGGSSSGSYGGSSYSGSMEAEILQQLLGSFLGGNASGVAGLGSGNIDFLLGRSLDERVIAETISENHFDSNLLVWTENADGSHTMSLPAEQWKLLHKLDLNYFFDDGEGYIDLGLDNVFEFTEDGALIGDTDGTWLSINGTPVAYKHLETVEDGEHYTITGQVPALLNGERVDLILVFDDENPKGYIAGARNDYRGGETDTQAKALTELQDGDVLDFLCDYYRYDGTFEDSYKLGDQVVIDGEPVIGNIALEKGHIKATYRFTDVFGQDYWAPTLDQ